MTTIHAGQLINAARLRSSQFAATQSPIASGAARIVRDMGWASSRAGTKKISAPTHGTTTSSTNTAG